MQRSTKITLREDAPTACSSILHGSNLNTVGFNISFINSRNPMLTARIFELFEEARKLAGEPEIERDHPVFRDATAAIQDLMAKREAA